MKRRDLPGRRNQNLPFLDNCDYGGDGAIFETKAETA